MSFRGVPTPNEALAAFLQTLRDDVDRLQNGGAIKGQVSFDPIIQIGGMFITVSPDGSQVTFTDAATGAPVYPNGNSNGGLQVTTTDDLPASPTAGETVVGTLPDGTSFALLYDAINHQWATDDKRAVTASTTTNDHAAYAIDFRGALLPFAPYLTFGLTLEVRVIANLNSGAASTTGVACLASTGPIGGTLTDDITNVSGEVSSAAAANVTEDSEWVILNTAVAVDDLIALNIGSKKLAGANSGNIRTNSTVHYHWTFPT